MPSLSEEFDWDAYHRDTRELSLDAKGAWWDCLYKMRLSPTRGRISMPLSSYARIFGVTPMQAKKALNEIERHKVGDFVHEADGSVTVINRRMFREWQERQDANYRQAKHRHGELVTGLTPDKNGAIKIVTELSQNNGESPSYKKKIDNVEGKEKKIRPSRIPSDFPLTEEMRGWALLNCPGLRIDAAHESFVEYWTNNTTAKALKVDWMLTWRKGMKLALKWQRESELRSSLGKQTEPVSVYGDCSVCANTRRKFPEVTDWRDPRFMEECGKCPTVIQEAA